jgi:hypothetical protein
MPSAEVLDAVHYLFSCPVKLVESPLVLVDLLILLLPATHDIID